MALLSFQFQPSDIEDLVAERGITVTYEAIRLWCNRFDPEYATKLKRKHQGYGDTFFIDEVFVRIEGIQIYLCRAVDQDGKLWMCISRSAEMVQQQSVSLKG